MIDNLGFIIQFTYAKRYYCFHLEPNDFGDMESDHWAWWNEFDENGYAAERSKAKGNLSFEIRGKIENKMPSMMNLEINVYHDGIYEQREQIKEFLTFNISSISHYN